MAMPVAVFVINLDRSLDRLAFMREQAARAGFEFERVAAVTDVVEHACSYDMAAELVDGMDVHAVQRATERAVARARGGGHPTLLEVRTYRYMGHSMSDPLHGVYRTKDEVEQYRAGDPIARFGRVLAERDVLAPDAAKQIDHDIIAEIEEAAKFADESPEPDPSTLFDYVFAKPLN